MDSRFLSLVDEELEDLLQAYLVGLVGETSNQVTQSYRWNGPNVERMQIQIGKWLIAKLGFPSDIDFSELIQQTAPTAASSVKRDYRQAIFHRDNFRCVKCGSDKDLTVDHIIPVSKGGTETLENLRTLCKPCNSRKGNRLDEPEN